MKSTKCLIVTCGFFGDIMFASSIAKWNDPKLGALNPGKKLPDAEITVVHRADGSGTTFNWTDYLATVSPEWLQRVGRGAAVKWPAVNSVGGKGNEGVAANVNRIKGSIGYVEYAYVKKNNMVFLQLQNKSGKFVSPDDLNGAIQDAQKELRKLDDSVPNGLKNITNKKINEITTNLSNVKTLITSLKSKIYQIKKQNYSQPLEEKKK